MNKKVLFIATFMTVMLSLSLTSCDKESIISKTDLPIEITSYITTHFPNNNIIQVIKDRDGLIKTYDIILS
ncbi:MAG TPA: hypothetical protein PKD85_14205, partial [Saprospiraceae bacterium]|nr:hypothetical protein [Saprospiraceae bacterium]